MKFILFLADPVQLQNMISVGNYSALSSAVSNRRWNIVAKLLNYPSVFSHADSHYHEYAECMHAFISLKLDILREKKYRAETINPHTVFDIQDRNDVQLCGCIIQTMIRRNDPSLRDDIQFLMNIPAVRKLMKNTRIIDVSNEISCLTSGESNRLNKALAHYQPLIRDLSIENIFTALYEQLKDNYRTSPAKIKMDNGAILVLPLTWEEFQQLPLTMSERKCALKAYYKHTNHTALRYLSKPNHWMAINASYVEVDSIHQDYRWSTFEEYKPLIALFYLAASDENIPSIDGHTVESRVNNFIKELALIGRAHNWETKDIRGNEHDDLQGDKPSCYSGVKRRLFQSVIGHPLLNILTLRHYQARTSRLSPKSFLGPHHRSQPNETSRNIRRIHN